MQAVIMVAGKSTRTYPLTLSRPKPLLPLLNRPLIAHSLDQMVDLVQQVILVVGYKKEMLEKTLGNEYRGIKLTYVEQKEQLGTGHAVYQAKPHIREKFIAMNGDDLFDRIDLEALIQLDNGALVKRVKDPSLYGVYQVDENNRVQSLVEKPTEYLGDLANIGCYVFQPDVFDVLETIKPSIRGEIEITDAISALAKSGDFRVQPTQGFWLPTGFAWDLLKHQEYFMPKLIQSITLGDVEPGAQLSGNVQIGIGTRIRAGAYIEGPVIIGDHCDIGPNCYIRGNTSIGDNCRVGNGVEIKNSLIMDNVMICHQSYIGDSVIGVGANIGAGCKTANKRHDDGKIFSTIKEKLVSSGRQKLGAIISDGVQLGINTSIYPGRKIWPNMTKPLLSLLTFKRRRMAENSPVVRSTKNSIIWGTE